MYIYILYMCKRTIIYLYVIYIHGTCNEMQTKNIALVLSLSLFLVTSGSVYYIYVCVCYTL